jgi:hypothetical protein
MKQIKLEKRKAFWAYASFVFLLFNQCVLIAAQTPDIDTNTVESWVSSNRFFSTIKLEVSRNYFVSDEATNFTIEPKDMVLIEGALLTNSFYIKYGEGAYKESIIQGVSDTDDWALSVQAKALMIGSRDTKLGGGENNWTYQATSKQANNLIGFTQFGLLYVKPGSLHISGTNFIATAIYGEQIIGDFSSMDDAGVPHSFRYHFFQAGGTRLDFEGHFEKIDTKHGEFDCIIARLENGKLNRRIRIRTVESLKQADVKGLDKIFRPSDFMQVKTTSIESNGIQYELLPSGNLLAKSNAVDSTPKTNPNKSWLIWIIIPNVIFLLVIIKLLKGKQKT